ncbi:MAG TPA: hypothetical protein PK185_17375, partial [Cyclobacteriaceae bacterium]|nr:hypothetical protein [Cyclobacteriaceae bacterium]
MSIRFLKRSLKRSDKIEWSISKSIAEALITPTLRLPVDSYNRAGLYAFIDAGKRSELFTVFVAVVCLFSVLSFLALFSYLKK